MEQHHRQHAQRRKHKAVEHHPLHAHLIQRQPAEVESRAPKATGQRAGPVAQKSEPPADIRIFCHPFFTLAYAHDSGITAQNGAHRREYIATMNRLTRVNLFVCAGRWLAVAVVLCTIGLAHSQSNSKVAPERSRPVKVRALPGAYPDKPSLPPVWTIPVEPLGFSPPGPLYLGSRDSLASLDFIDENRLLFTFRVPGLIHRQLQAGETSEGDERRIRAVVLTLPTGAVEAEALWSVHDHSRYVWMLKDGHFLFRDRNSLQQGDAHLEMKPLLQFPGPLLGLDLDPAQQFLVSNSREPASVQSKQGE